MTPTQQKTSAGLNCRGLRPLPEGNEMPTLTRDLVTDLITATRARLERQGSHRGPGWMPPLTIHEHSVRHAMEVLRQSIHSALLIEVGFCPFLLDRAEQVRLPERINPTPPVTVGAALDRIASHLIKERGVTALLDTDRNVDSAATIRRWEQHSKRTEREVLDLMADVTRPTAQLAARKDAA